MSTEALKASPFTMTKKFNSDLTSTASVATLESIKAINLAELQARCQKKPTEPKSMVAAPKVKEAMTLAELQARCQKPKQALEVSPSQQTIPYTTRQLKLIPSESVTSKSILGKRILPNDIKPITSSLKKTKTTKELIEMYSQKQDSTQSSGEKLPSYSQQAIPEPQTKQEKSTKSTVSVTERLNTRPNPSTLIFTESHANEIYKLNSSQTRTPQTKPKISSAQIMNQSSRRMLLASYSPQPNISPTAPTAKLTQQLSEKTNSKPKQRQEAIKTSTEKLLRSKQLDFSKTVSSTMTSPQSIKSPQTRKIRSNERPTPLKSTPTVSPRSKTSTLISIESQEKRLKLNPSQTSTLQIKSTTHSASPQNPSFKKPTFKLMKKQVKNTDSTDIPNKSISLSGDPEQTIRSPENPTRIQEAIKISQDRVSELKRLKKSSKTVSATTKPSKSMQSLPGTQSKKLQALHSSNKTQKTRTRVKQAKLQADEVIRQALSRKRQKIANLIPSLNKIAPTHSKPDNPIERTPSVHTRFKKPTTSTVSEMTRDQVFTSTVSQMTKDQMTKDQIFTSTVSEMTKDQILTSTVSEVSEMTKDQLRRPTKRTTRTSLRIIPTMEEPSMRSNNEKPLPIDSLALARKSLKKNQPQAAPKKRDNPKLKESSVLVEQSGSDLTRITQDGLLLGLRIHQKKLDAYFKATGDLGGGRLGKIIKANCRHDNACFGLKKSTVVAIKCIRVPTLIHSFNLEPYNEKPSVLEKLLSISHENVIKYYGTYLKLTDAETAFHRYLVFEHVNRVTLATIIHKIDAVNAMKTKPSNSIKVAHINYLFKQIFTVFQCLYDYKISHRDLHGSNLIYSRETHKLKVIDFGLSQLIEDDANELKNANLFDIQRCFTTVLAFCFLKNPLYTDAKRPPLKDSTVHSKPEGCQPMTLSWRNTNLLDPDIKATLTWSATLTNQLGLYYFTVYTKESSQVFDSVNLATLQRHHSTIQSIRQSEPLPSVVINSF